MESTSTPLKNISDTAFLVATYRAMESERKDAVFSDPYASVLAGEHGRNVVAAFKGNSKHSWFLVGRTSILDHWILDLIENHPIDTVINLAAGLDARAYRMKLPKSLRWFDVDLPEILSYKEKKLKNFQPNCSYQSIKLDLADISKRNDFFQRVAADSKQTLVISEGFLMYLTPEIAASLAEELSGFPQFKFWLAELLGPHQLKWIKLKWGKQFEKANAVMNFAPSEGPDFFIPYHWNPLKFRSSLIEAIRLNRAPLGVRWLTLLRYFLPKSWVKRINTAGIALLENKRDF